MTEWFDIRKVIGALVMPVGALWLVLLLTAAVASRIRRSLGTLLWLVWCVYTFAGNGLASGFLVDWLERDFVTTDPFSLPHLDAILVLGGGIGQHPNGQVALAEAGDRVMLAARLYHRQKVGTLITTGPLPAVTDGSLLSVPGMTFVMWQDLGIPASDIMVIEGPRATSDEIQELEDLVAERQWQRVGVLTSAYHLRRTMRLCERRNLTVTAIPANLSTSSGPLRPAHLIPAGSGFSHLHLACWEIVGAAVGR